LELELKKIGDFLIGFVGWFVVHSVIWTLAPQPDLYGVLLLLVWVIIVLPINIVVLSRTRGWLAFGIVAALAVNFLLTLVQMKIADALLFIPFYLDPWTDWRSNVRGRNM
jgi:hypothetical protein